MVSLNRTFDNTFDNTFNNTFNKMFNSIFFSTSLKLYFDSNTINKLIQSIKIMKIDNN